MRWFMQRQFFKKVLVGQDFANAIVPVCVQSGVAIWSKGITGLPKNADGMREHSGVSR
jgi:hypothetical protein